MLEHISQPRSVLLASILLTVFLLISVFSTNLLGQRQRIDSLKSLKNQDPEAQLHILEELGNEYKHLETDSSVFYYENGIALARELDQREALGRMLKNLGITLMFRGDKEMASTLFEEALEIFQANNRQKDEAHVYNSLGIMADMQGNSKEAAKQYQKSIEIAQEINDQNGIAMAENNLAMIWQDMGRYDDALAGFLHTLKIRKEQNLVAKVANVLNNISRLHAEQGNLTEALLYAREALSVMKAEKEDYYVTALTYSQLGSIFRGLVQWDSAIFYLEKQIVLEQILEDKSSEAEAVINLGRSYQGEKNWTQAKINFQKAQGIAQEIENKVLLAEVSYSLGNLFLERNDYRSAIPALKKALSIFEDIPLKIKVSGIYENLANAYSGLGQKDQAYSWLQKHVVLKDTLLNKARIDALADVEERYENAQQEKEIISLESQNTQQRLDLSRQRWIIGFSLAFLLFLIAFALYLYQNTQQRKKRNLILQAQKEEIEVQNKRNELLLKEIHHRVKNNLQTISSLLSLQTAHIQDDTVREVVAEGQHRVESMALIHQKLYQRENLAAVEMKDYLGNLGESLFSTYGITDSRISLNIDMEELELDVDAAVPIGLIVNELLSNSLKYAFSEQETGEIHISLFVNPHNKLQLLVRDNGKGMEKGSAPQGTGFGSSLVQLLTKQLRGTSQIENEQGYKTLFEFTEYQLLNA